MKTRTDLINFFIKKYTYKTYLEIGVRNTKKNFDRINAEIKVGVDPDVNAKASHTMTSDEFFKNNKEKFDIIFIDGLHLKEQVVKDIKNSLDALAEGGVIILHDCNPPTEFHQRENYEVDGKFPAWNGTTWKAYVHARYTYTSCDIYCIDTDYGCGVIKPQTEVSRVMFDIDYNNIHYNDLNKNRKNILNLITVEEFKEKIEKSC